MFTFDRCIETLLNRLHITNLFLLIGRVLMAYLFIIAGWDKIINYSDTASYMTSQGIPGGLLFLVILLELGGGLAIFIGYQTRIIALCLAFFCIATALIFHSAPEESTDLMKNLALAGGFIYIFVQGAGKFSTDNLLIKKHSL